MFSLKTRLLEEHHDLALSGNPGFSRRERGANLKGKGDGDILFGQLPPKLHINEENWAEGVFLCYILPSGGSRISQMLCADPRGGPQPIILPDLCRKLHENEMENLEPISNLH